MNTSLMMASSLRTLTRNKLKTFFMSISVIVGVATLIAGQSLGAGAGQQISERVNKMFGPGSILLFSSNLKQADLDAIEQQLPQIAGISPRLYAGELEVSYQGINRQIAIFGHTDSGEYVWNRSIIEGRFITESDVRKSARVALIGTRLSQFLFKEESPIDREILIKGVPFEIVGVLEDIGIDPHGEDRDEDIFVPISTSMRRLYNVDIVGSAKILVSDHEQVAEDSDDITRILRERFQVADDEPDGFYIYTSKFAGRSISDANQVLRTYLYAAAGIALLVAATVIASIMQIVVRERTGEIGLRKAVGATGQNISVQFLAETVSIAGVSGILGIVAGILAANLISYFIDVPVVMTKEMILVGLVSAVGVGIISGILPAQSAAKLDPVESLR
jgi:putative ABC transport system permease protein